MRQISLFTLIIILLASCYKDYDNTVTEQERELPETTMESGLTGRVLGNSGVPLTAYDLVVNGETYSHQQEFFYNYIDNLRKYGQIIFIEKDGQDLGFSNALLIENDINFSDLRAFPNKSQIEFSGFSLSINFSNQVIIGVTKDQLLDNQNSEPTGDIVVESLSIVERDLLLQAGSFGYNSNGGLLSLEPAELFYIAFLNQDGDDLSISTNDPPIFSISDQNMSLLKLDLEKGYWVEIYNPNVDIESPIMTDGGYYLLAETTPGVYSQGVCIKGDRPVSYITADYTNDQNTNIHTVTTTSKGQWAIATRSEVEVDMSYMTPCGDAVTESEVIVSEASREDYIIELPTDVMLLDLNTEVIDCSGELSNLPAVSVIDANNVQSIYVYNSDGIETWLPVCSDQVDISGYDILANNSGALLDWNLDINDAIGYLSYCEDFEDGFSYISIRDEVNVYNSPMLSSDGMSTLLEENENRFRVNFFGNKTGSYERKDVRMFLEDSQFGDQGYKILCETTDLGCGFTDFNVTHYNINTDGWTRVSFAGNIWMQTLNPPLAGEFEVKGVIMHK